MIGISKLYLGTVEPSDPLRYGRKSSKLPSKLLQFSMDKKPVVVWNLTRACNLKCVHCYANATLGAHGRELSTEEGEALLRDLAGFGVPVVLFSGGEPLLRKDLVHLIEYAVGLGLRAVISTNGTLIGVEQAKKFVEIGLSYVGVSIDGLREANDSFRGQRGAFDESMAGIEALMDAGIKVGLRFTMSRRNVAEIPGIFDLMLERRIPRICFYHLVYSGRGSDLMEDALSAEETRRTVDLIIDRTVEMFRAGHRPEVLTVDNHTDGVYLYRRLLSEDPERAARVMELLRMNGGNSTGLGIASIGWDGSVHPDQFWREHVVGNVREKPFSEIWGRPTDPLLIDLRRRKEFLTGRCAKCTYLDICNGNFRARAEAVHNDPWAPDPACYLTDEEIGIAEPVGNIVRNHITRG